VTFRIFIPDALNQSATAPRHFSDTFAHLDSPRDDIAKIYPRCADPKQIATSLIFNTPTLFDRRCTFFAMEM
jgi:hypothetical protein